MRMRESGMPDQQTWSGFFSPSRALENLLFGNVDGNVADFGCGYGTFALPAAEIISGMVYAIDIDEMLLKQVREKAEGRKLQNVITLRKDLLEESTGLDAGSCIYVMLFNVLHCERPLRLLLEAKRILVPGGLVGIIHWISDPTTPRGPSKHIRPTPGQCGLWIEQAGLNTVLHEIPLPPFHYGIVARKPEAQ